MAAVLEHLERCRAERDRLENAEVSIEGAERALAEAEKTEAKLADSLSKARRKAAPGLAERVRAELAELAMEDASFEVVLHERDELAGTGAEQVEFLIAPNPGVPAAPVRDSASGGELSRVMLALMSVASTGGPATLVFDEVDAGVGGQTARAVGDRLRALSEGRQVLCITHLPQIASLRDPALPDREGGGGRAGPHDGRAARGRPRARRALPHAGRRREGRRRPQACGGTAGRGLARDAHGQRVPSALHGGVAADRPS